MRRFDMKLPQAALAALVATGLAACVAPATEDNPGTSTGGTGAGPGSGGSNGGGTGGGDRDPDEIDVVLPSECDGSALGSRLLRRLTRMELLNTHQDVFGAAASAATTDMPGDSVARLLLSNDASILTMNQDGAQALLDRAEEIATAATEPTALAQTLPCAASSPDAACATTFIQDYGQRLFRRALTQADTDRYLGMYNSISAASDFPTAIKWVLVSLIQSPYTVYRSELGEGGGQLLPHEIASALSYDYAASPPSPELMAKALAGDLDDPEVRYQEALALLNTPRGKEVIRRFFIEWLQYRDVLTVSRAETTADFEAARPKMVLETEAFLDKLLFEKSGGLADLLTANYTFADAELAAYYGFTGGAGDFAAGTAAEVPRDFGLGVFAQGSVTATMSSITVTSPTRRGLLLLRRLYCRVPGLPQAINFDLTSDEVEGNTTRERLESSHLDPGCATCHQIFDPLGFAFEHFDHVGRYRTEEVTPAGSFPIDATATVATLGGLAIDGQDELMMGLVEDEQVLGCVSETMTRYVYGSGGTCRAPDAQSKVMSGESTIVEFLADLARAPHFASR